MLLVENRGKQNAKASKINAFTKNGVDPIARSNNKKATFMVVFLLLKWEEDPRKSGPTTSERQTEVCRSLKAMSAVNGA
ncbi:MAG: hypothetical protein IJ830_06755 [Alphaproteobacteria bacterium]|nr:hypothetical protein [Alphaproteobacteria bacterium]